MPIRHRLKREKPAGTSQLLMSLLEEWKNPKDEGEPLIVVEGSERQPIHIYVIWEAWQSLSDYERSELIMDAVEQLAEEGRFSQLNDVTVAMGLTSDEARRMGIATE